MSKFCITGRYNPVYSKGYDPSCKSPTCIDMHAMKISCTNKTYIYIYVCVCRGKQLPQATAT